MRKAGLSMKEKKNDIHAVVLILGIAALYILQFVTHRLVPFMMDDEWYSTNLATGAPLSSLADVVEGQAWHYLNWGGRSITHGVLQLTLMSGELCADILNVIMTFLLAYMICIVSGQKTRWSFLMSSSMLVAFNANAKMSMFWQSGLVNYVYSSVWILAFFWLYIEMTKEQGKACLLQIGGFRKVLLTIAILPLGLITGWSNENMGPTCFLLSVAVIFYLGKIQKKQVPLWMYLGAAASLIGSLFVILAPGNFVRSNAIEEKTLWQKIYDRFFSMFEAGIEFLFPVIILLIVLLVIYLVVLRGKLQVGQIMMIAGILLSYGAMVLSPHYPDRATFGTMVFGIVVIIGTLGALEERVSVFWIERCRQCGIIFQLALWICSVGILLQIMFESGI